MAKTRTAKSADDVGKLSFEDALSELEGIVRKLETGDVDLDESIAIYERGTRLKAHCEAKLAAAKAKVEKITLSSDGSVRAIEADLS
mgnify:CR=1 FL=1